MMDKNNPSANRLGIKRFIPGIALFFFVSFLLFLPGADFPKVNDWFNKIYFDKWVHVGLFAGLAFLFMRPVTKSALTSKAKWNYILKIAIAASLWGITSEFIQKYFIPGRNFDLYDWAADSFGALVALLFCKKRFLKNK